MEALTPAERQSLYSILGVDTVAEIFTYLDDAEPYLKELPSHEAAKVISNMDSDDAVDALEVLTIPIKTRSSTSWTRTRWKM